MITHFVPRSARSVPEALATSIRRHVQARFDRNEQTVLDYGPYEGWDHSHYACDVNRPQTSDPELLAMLESASDLYRPDVVEFARRFELGVREGAIDRALIAEAPGASAGPEVVSGVRLVSAFVTRYLPGNKRFDDHDDLCDVSLVVEISDSDYEGGGVVGSDGTPWTRVRLDSRERGAAVIIGRGISHKTIPLTSGIRWAVVVFYRYV